MGLWKSLKKFSKGVDEFFESIGEGITEFGDTIIGEKARQDAKERAKNQRREAAATAAAERESVAREIATDRLRRRRGLAGRSLLRSSFQEQMPTVGRSRQGSTMLGRGA